MLEWRVTIRCRGETGEDVTPELMAAILGGLRGYAAVGESNPGYVGLTLAIDAPTAAKAKAAALSALKEGRAAGLPDWPVTKLEVVPWDAVPVLVGIPEIAEMLRVHVERVRELVRENDSFPAPVGQLGKVKIWTQESVRTWADTWPRKPGRPRKPKGSVEPFRQEATEKAAPAMVGAPAKSAP